MDITRQQQQNIVFTQTSEPLVFPCFSYKPPIDGQQQHSEDVSLEALFCKINQALAPIDLPPDPTWSTNVSTMNSSAGSEIREFRKHGLEAIAPKLHEEEEQEEQIQNNDNHCHQPQDHSRHVLQQQQQQQLTKTVIFCDGFILQQESLEDLTHEGLIRYRCFSEWEQHPQLIPPEKRLLSWGPQSQLTRMNYRESSCGLQPHSFNIDTSSSCDTNEPSSPVNSPTLSCSNSPVPMSPFRDTGTANGRSDNTKKCDNSSNGSSMDNRIVKARRGKNKVFVINAPKSGIKVELCKRRPADRKVILTIEDRTDIVQQHSRMANFFKGVLPEREEDQDMGCVKKRRKRKTSNIEE